MERSPLKAIRRYCLACVGGSAQDVKHCTGPLIIGQEGRCFLWPFRFGKGRKSGVVADRSPLQAIKKNCTWCSGGSPKERELCPSSICALKPYRNGKLPTAQALPGGAHSADFDLSGVSARKTIHRTIDL